MPDAKINAGASAARLAGVHDRMAEAAAPLGGFLRCEVCHRREEIDKGLIGRYLQHGWPRCCRYTMRWWTARQVKAGEAPDD